jgi:DNA-directed RNA polymerase subunit N (RpoN/RPB10)
MKINWRCYVCGKPIGEEFACASMNIDTDRIFLMCSEKCTRQLDDAYVLYVKKVKEGNPCKK